MNHPHTKVKTLWGNCSSKDPIENGRSNTTQDQGQSSSLNLQGNGETGSKDDSRTDAEDVQRVVYYLSDSLQPIQDPDEYRLVQDELRIQMIRKWMKYYTWYPDRTNFFWPRTELKARLKLPTNTKFTTMIRSTLLNQFESFQRWGLVTYKNGLYIYQASTDRWLERGWDGKLTTSASLPNVSVLVLS